MCYDGQWHCNAHANNVTILDESVAPSADHPMFLGYRTRPCCAILSVQLRVVAVIRYLDLDMAFNDKTL